MKIIDAHIHYAKNEYFDQIAIDAGHTNSPEGVEKMYRDNRVVYAVVMSSGNADDQEYFAMTPDLAGKLTTKEHKLLSGPYPFPDYVGYCVGIQSRYLTDQKPEVIWDTLKQHMENPHCLGFKMYPGYNPFYLDDPIHDPIYELAKAYHVPVDIHTGDTASSTALVEYAHPLTVDRVAVRYPEVKFVMCHYGNPWIVDASEVLMKNPNVYADVSGLLEGNFDPDEFCNRCHGYLEQFRTWMNYIECYDKILFGTDWPLPNISSYIKLIQAMIPEKYHEQVFFENALKVYDRIRPEWFLDS